MNGVGFLAVVVALVVIGLNWLHESGRPIEFRITLGLAFLRDMGARA